MPLPGGPSSRWRTEHVACRQYPRRAALSDMRTHAIDPRTSHDHETVAMPKAFGTQARSERAGGAQTKGLSNTESVSASQSAVRQQSASRA
jgi:hypothetical protein